jgi:hypothetical protein
LTAAKFVATWMQRAATVIVVVAIGMPSQAQNADDSLKVYAVNVVKTTPFEKPFTGDGIYLGNGAVITAAHVIGRWGFLKDVHVLIAGQNLPARIIKEGSVERTDLTLLSVDETRLPIGLRLRRNPLCRQALNVGENVMVVVAGKTEFSQIISPLLIAPEFRERFNSLIGDVGTSGSGVYDAKRKCLVGIISRKFLKVDYRKDGDRITAELSGFAKYFVPAAEIAIFIPPRFHF